MDINILKIEDFKNINIDKLENYISKKKEKKLINFIK